MVHVRGHNRNKKEIRWIRFYDFHGGKELARISGDGLFAGEILATQELLANERGIPRTRVKWDWI